MFEVKINITLKRTVSDPQGLTIKQALESLNYQGLEEVRVGKLITIKINSRNKEKIKQSADQMCRKLLANPIIENYSFKIEKIK